MHAIGELKKHENKFTNSDVRNKIVVSKFVKLSDEFIISLFRNESVLFIFLQSRTVLDDTIAIIV
jgi:hypothetical protein